MRMHSVLTQWEVSLALATLATLEMAGNAQVEVIITNNLVIGESFCTMGLSRR